MIEMKIPRIAAAALAALTLAACGDAEPDVEGAAGGPDTVPMVAPSDPAPAAETGDLVDPNTAGEEQLARVSGLDSAAISTILRGRPFDDMMAFHQALSERMDSAALDAVYRQMFIPLDLNSASRETILLIPGVGERMAAEFLEYRPYRGIEEFRREIGKYVDEAEVVRLERYVTLEAR